jgi:predicted nucleotidyltransferase
VASVDTPPRFYELLRTLREHGAEFVIIGGFAVSMDARPAEFGDFKPQEMPMPFTPEGLLEGGGNWVVYTTFGRVDLMPYVEDADGELTYDELRAAADTIEIDEVGHPIFVASVEHLIAMKQHAGRDLDLIDVTALRMAHGLEED